MLELTGRTAVVSGGSSGIGLSIANTFAAQGATVHVLDLRPSEVDNAGASAGKIEFHACDVASRASVDAVFGAILDGGPIDILVNNAGISCIGNLENTSEEDLDRVFSVNVKGAYNCLSRVIGPMKAQGGGVILNVASVAASCGLSDRFAYSMSKGAMVAMTYSVAKDYLTSNIRCNCISPARVHTSFVDNYLRKHYPGEEDAMFQKLAKSQPIGRMADPREVAALALFLCSNEAEFITGTDYPIDGGFLKLHG